MAKLGEVCAEKIETLDAKYSGKIDYIDISSVDNCEKKIVQVQEISAKDAPSRAKQLIQDGDVIVSLVRPNLNAVAIVGGQNKNLQVASTGYCVLRSNPKIYNRYLFNFCQSDTFINKMVSQATGASYPAVSNSIVKSCEIPLPNLNQQKRVADILDKVTALISLRKQQLFKLDELVKARFVEMFDAISPKKCASKIGECAEVLGGYAFKSDCFSNQGVPVVRIGNINDGRIDIDYNTCYAEEFWNKNPRFQARKYDILMAMSGATTGKVGIYKSDERLLINQRVACIRARDDESAIFLFACLQLPWMYNLVQEASAGCAQPNISGKQIETMPVPKPETSKVHQFAAFVERVDQQKQTIQQSLDKLELMKKALMQEYFG